MMYLCGTGLGVWLPGCPHSSAGQFCPVSNPSVTMGAELLAPSRRWEMILKLMWWQEIILKLVWWQEVILKLVWWQHMKCHLSAVSFAFSNSRTGE